jgi:hypothetical protein
MTTPTPKKTVSPNGSLSLRDRLVQMGQVKRKKITLGDEEVWLHGMTLEEMGEVSARFGENIASQSAVIAASCLHDGEGRRLFTTSDEDLRVLRGMSAAFHNQIMEHIVELNGGVSPVEQAKKN